MNLDLSSMMLGAFGLSLILITLSLLLLRGAPTAQPGYSTGARFFLIALRLAIGWHCFVEGMEKLAAPTWSGEAYLRESMGPFASLFRDVAGDRLIEKLTVNDETFPPALDRDWRNLAGAFAAYYDCDEAQLKQIQRILDQREADTLNTLTTGKELITKIAPHPPDLTEEWTMPKRLEEHQKLLERVRTIEAKFPTSDKDVHAEWKKAKADLAKWRAGLEKTLAAETNKLKALDPVVKAKVSKAVEELSADLKKAKDPAEAKKIQKKIDFEKAKLWESLADVLTSEQKALDSQPAPRRLPIAEWRMLEWSDALVMWGLIVLGGGLLLGFCTRLSCFLTGLLILSFYLAMPPLPGWPESPRLEGHYLIINKTLIEVLALFALSFIPTGRWAGLDGILVWFCPSGDRTQK